MANEICKIRKKNGTLENYNRQKIIDAVKKSAERAMYEFKDFELTYICTTIEEEIVMLGLQEVPILKMHNMVESALEKVNPTVAKSYKDYRNYKTDFVGMLDDIYKKSQSIMYIGDKENANTDSTLVATKRSLVFNQLNKELYQKFFLNVEELQAARDGYIYIHDMSARRDTMNCFSRATRFITDRGVKSFYDFTDGDVVNVISHKGIWRKAIVHSYGWQELQSVKFKRANGKEKEVLVTPNHRWILKDGSETTNLKVCDKLIYTPNITNFNYEERIKENISYQLYSDDGDRTWFVTDIQPATYDEVWCLEVEEDHSFLLEDGIPTGNCCLFDIEHVLKDGFEMGNVWYNEPKSLDTAFDVIGDIVLSAASQQYGEQNCRSKTYLTIPMGVYMCS